MTLTRIVVDEAPDVETSQVSEATIGYEEPPQQVYQTEEVIVVVNEKTRQEPPLEEREAAINSLNTLTALANNIERAAEEEPAFDTNNNLRVNADVDVAKPTENISSSSSSAHVEQMSRTQGRIFLCLLKLVDFYLSSLPFYHELYEFTILTICL